MRRSVSVLVLIAVVTSSASLKGAQDDLAGRPNIVWIIVEDMSPQFACYGETTIATPNVDRLASEGLRFANATVTAPVCSTCRSALVTGMYQTTIGAHHHRSGRGALKITLPDDVTPVPELFCRAGYQSLNLTFEEFVRSADAVTESPRVGVAKTDYNFVWNPQMYGDMHWSRREHGQPFFCQIQLRGGKLRGHGNGDRWPARAASTLGARTQPGQVKLPPYLPDHPIILEDWAQYLDTVRYTDWQVGRIVDRLRDAGEWDRTYLFFITDHGISHVRNKQFCYDGGMRIPLIVRGPSISGGMVREDPVEHIDLAATSLALASIPIPTSMQARDILADDYVPRRYSVSARDRCDETVDRIRAVRSPRWKYLRNFYPDRPYLAPNRYKDAKPIVQAMRQLYADGGLNDAQAKIMADHRPPEELYDLERDPFELVNLADDPRHRERLTEMREVLQDWMRWSGDRGRQPEPQAQYDSDMSVYLGGGDSERAAILKRNIRQMKQWAEAGK